MSDRSPGMGDGRLCALPGARGSAVLCAASAIVAACGAGTASQGDPFVEPDSYGAETPRPDGDEGSQRSTTRADLALPPAEAAHGAAATTDVRVNGELLSEPDLVQLEVLLGARPAPGNYWYDPDSGLWGLVGHGAAGVTKAGLPASPMAVDVSRGGSRVRVNGRLITVTELRTMARLLSDAADGLEGYIGRYTLDAQGKLYRVGGAYLGNLARAAMSLQTDAPSVGQCAWLSFGQPPGVLGRGVTVGCD